MADQPYDEQRFVVQRHDATAMHFDLRLQVGHVLASWAVPKGPSLDPAVKRLAHRTEDHSMEHLAYEGTTGHSRRGISTTIVWDTGLFASATIRRGRTVDTAEALRRGHLRFVLSGRRLVGGFALTHTKMGGDDANWLLVKVDDEFAVRGGEPTETMLDSVLSGRTNEDLRIDEPED